MPLSFVAIGLISSVALYQFDVYNTFTLISAAINILIILVGFNLVLEPPWLSKFSIILALVTLVLYTITKWQTLTADAPPSVF